MLARFAKGALLALAGMVASSLAVANDDWTLELDEGGVQLFTRASDNSEMKSCKVVTTLKGSLSSIVALLNDQKNFPNWMDKLVKAERLQALREDENLFYTVVDSPWPAKDQDNIIYTKWTQDPTTYEMVQTIMSEPEYLSPAKGKQRQSYFRAEWRLLPVGDGNVHVTYTADVDPGTKTIPRWMSNMFVYEMPVKTLRNMASVPMGDYEGASFAYVQEPVDTAIVMTSEE
jgi:hypothetical protein